MTGLLTTLSIVITLSAGPSPTEESLLEGMKRISNSPHMVDPVLAAMCRSPFPSEWEAHQEEFGPHDIAVDIYLNDTARQDLFANRDFREGAVLIKKQQPRPERFDKMIGGMRKMEAGYDPDNGNWEYFTLSAENEFQSGRIDYCIACHRQAEHQVFRYWFPRPASSPSGSR